MPEFGVTSMHRLRKVHPELRAILFEAVELYDITIPPLGGARTQTQQNELVADGKSKTANSKHVIQKDGYSHAVDVIPYPVDWNDANRFFFMAGAIFSIANRRGVLLRWGHDWDMDMDFRDQTFNDSPHFELVLEE